MTVAVGVRMAVTIQGLEHILFGFSRENKNVFCYFSLKKIRNQLHKISDKNKCFITSFKRFFTFHILYVKRIFVYLSKKFPVFCFDFLKFLLNNQNQL